MSEQGKDLEICVLLDFYGDLLTEKQFNLMDLYYNDDLSLGEISELQHITRQGVRDSIQRSKSFLLETESKMKLVENYRKNCAVFREIAEQIKELYPFVAKHGGLKQQGYCERILELAESRLNEE